MSRKIITATVVLLLSLTSSLSFAELTEKNKQYMISKTQSCGLDLSANDASWKLCSSFLESSRGIEDVHDGIYTLRDKPENYKFTTRDKNGEFVSLPYYKSLPLVCRDLGWGDTKLKRAMDEYAVMMGLDKVSPESMSKSETEKHNKYVAVYNNYIDLSNTIFRACATQDESLIVNELKGIADNLEQSLKKIQQTGKHF